MVMTKILVRYAEIALKGKNLNFFENSLISNLKRSLNLPNRAVTKLRKQILIEVDESLINQSLKKLEHIFGVAWFAPVVEVKTDLTVITKAVVSLAKKQIKNKDTFAIAAHRNDKTISFTSQEADRELGAAVIKATKAKVDLSKPDKTIYLDLGKINTFIYSAKLAGAGGLPDGGFDVLAFELVFDAGGAIGDGSDTAQDDAAVLPEVVLDGEGGGDGDDGEVIDLAVLELRPGAIGLLLPGGALVAAGFVAPLGQEENFRVRVDSLQGHFRAAVRREIGTRGQRDLDRLGLFPQRIHFPVQHWPLGDLLGRQEA